jgi:hypothetical protein
MVADQLDALLGEHLMPLRVRSASEDAPHLLAVDASGEPVVVEIVALLDEAAVIRALRHAGRASRMSTAELAAAYSGGADRFAMHLAAFRLTVPSTALLSTMVRGGARLLLVCSHVAPGMEDVLEFLLQPGWQVDVLRAEVVGQPDGTRVVELSPVSRSEPPQRAIERPPWARDAEPEPDLFDPTPLFRARVEATRLVRPSAPAPAPQPSWSAPSAQPLTHPGWPWPPDDAAELLEQTSPTWATSRPAPQVVPPSFAVPVTSLDAKVPLDTVTPDPALAAVAGVLDGPVALVWCPMWATECYEALLHADGTLEATNGARFADVETLTRSISGYTGPLDAWQAWRVDSPGGPSLADLAEELFPDQF